MIDFENLGYKDITKNAPISFSECFGETFGTLFPYEKRYYLKEGDIVIVLKVGTCYNKYDISGICYHPKGWERFGIHSPFHEYAKEHFEKTIKAVKYKISNL